MTFQAADTEFDRNDIAGAADEALGEDNFEELYGDKPVRWYQIAARNGVEAALELNRNARILIVLPTGAGKTITSGLVFSSRRVRAALGVPDDRKLRLLFIAHKHRLLSQAEEAYAAAENVELIIQSAYSDLSPELLEQGWDITCIDEAHHEAMATIQYHLERIGDKPIIGLTATPDRADGCLIKFDVIVNPITREEAVEQGYLARTKIHTFVDVPSKEKATVLADVFEHYAHQMGQTMVFVKTQKEVTEVTTTLINLGYAAVGVIKQTEAQLDALLNQFSRKEIQFIVNCNKINEGVDVKGCTDVVLGRHYGSYSQLNQVIGRAARPDSECNVWELVNPLSGRNLDTTIIVGTPESHRLVYKQGGAWRERVFDYVGTMTNAQLGMAPTRSARR